jgi:outer membrane protein assembly factor BamB
MIARLNTQTHQVIWQHTFSHEDVLANGSPAVPGPDQPFVSGGIIYVSTLANLGPGKRYLSALNAANGAVLWRQPSARAFANSTTLYTLVESQTLALSILTARDPRSGKQLWQRQYPIAGAKSDPAYGTDMTEGFRLVAVTDQLLYAVVVYRQQGQNLFARYGLSPVDGSIRWHTQEVIAGRMPLVEAHIASGIIYAAEYTLQSTTPHLDAHGMTIDEVPRVRVGAYDLATGHQLWQTPYMPGEEPNGGFDLTVSDDMLYLQTFNNQWPETARYPQTITTWHALDRRDGTVRWQYQKKDEGGMTGAALLGNSLYIEVSTITTHSTGQSLQVQIVALNAQPGTVRWATPVHLLNGSEKTPTPVSSIDPGMSGSYTIDMAPVADGSTVYYSVPGNRIYALQASDGRILTQFWVNKTAQTTVLDRLALFVA